MQLGVRKLAIAARVLLRRRADDQRARRAPFRLQERQRLDEDIDALQLAQLADEEEVGGVLRADDRLEVLGPQAVAHDIGGAARRPDLLPVGPRLVGGDVDQPVGQTLKRALDREIDAPGERRGA